MDNVYTAFRPFYLFSKLIGAFSMTFEGSVKNGVLKTKIWDIVISILSICLIFVMIFVKFQNVNVVRVNSSFFSITWNYLIVLELFFLIIHLCFQHRRCYKIKNLLKALNKFDLDLEKFGFFVEFKEHKKLAYFSASAVFILNLLLGFITLFFYFHNNSIEQRNFLVVYSYGHKNMFKLFFAFQLFLANSFVKYRLKLLNSFFKLVEKTYLVIFSNRYIFRSSWRQRNEKVFHVMRRAKNIKSISKLFLDLCDAIEIVNSFFTFHTIFMVISSTVSF